MVSRVSLWILGRDTTDLGEGYRALGGCCMEVRKNGTMGSGEWVPQIGGSVTTDSGGYHRFRRALWMVGIVETVSGEVPQIRGSTIDSEGYCRIGGCLHKGVEPSPNEKK